MARHKDIKWNLSDTPLPNEQAQIAVLMDIRDEMKKLNQLLHCDNFIAIPRILRRVSANTAKPRKRARK